MRKNKQEKLLPSRSQGLIAESDGPRSTQGRPKQVIIPPQEEDNHPHLQPGSSGGSEVHVGQGSRPAAPSRWFGCGGRTGPGLGWRQDQDIRTGKGCRQQAGALAFLTPGVPRDPTLSLMYLGQSRGKTGKSEKSLENQHSTAPAMQLSCPVPVSLGCQQASQPQCWAAESAGNLPCRVTGPASEGLTPSLKH